MGFFSVGVYGGFLGLSARDMVQRLFSTTPQLNTELNQFICG